MKNYEELKDLIDELNSQVDFIMKNINPGDTDSRQVEKKVDYLLGRVSSKTVSLKELDDVNLDGLTITNGRYNLGSGGGGSGITWTEVTTTTQAAAVNNGYVSNNASRVTVTLPVTATVGQSVLIQGSGAGGWRLGQNDSQTISWDVGGVAGTDITTAGVTGYIQSSDRYDSIEVMCITPNTGWVVRNSKGNLNIN